MKDYIIFILFDVDIFKIIRKINSGERNLKNYASKDYYKTLGLSFEASAEDIKKAFRKATVKFHPDVNKNGEKIFLEIKEAYEVLIDENERKNYDFIKGYDLLRKQKQQEKIKENFEKRKYQSSVNSDESKACKKSENVSSAYKKNSDFSPKNDEKVKNTSENINKSQNFGDTLKDIVSGLFSQKNNKSYSGRENLSLKDGDDITMPVEISYKEAINGTNRKINVLHTEMCPICEGKKFSNGSKCKYCKGTGEVSLHKKLNVKIPPHTENNKKIRLIGEGTKGLKGGKNGNLYLVVKITDDSFFKFEGNNVFCEAEISPYEAALGGEKQVKTLSGMAKLKIPAGTSSGQKFRLAKEGLFDENTKTKGDQIVTIKIKIGENLSEREKKLYEELRNISEEK